MADQYDPITGQLVFSSSGDPTSVPRPVPPGDKDLATVIRDVVNKAEGKTDDQIKKLIDGELKKIEKDLEFQNTTNTTPVESEEGGPVTPKAPSKIDEPVPDTGVLTLEELEKRFGILSLKPKPEPEPEPEPKPKEEKEDRDSGNDRDNTPSWVKEAREKREAARAAEEAKRTANFKANVYKDMRDRGYAKVGKNTNKWVKGDSNTADAKSAAAHPLGGGYKPSKNKSSKDKSSNNDRSNNRSNNRSSNRDSRSANSHPMGGGR